MNTIFSPKKGDLAQIMNKEHRMSNVESNQLHHSSFPVRPPHPGGLVRYSIFPTKGDPVNDRASEDAIEESISANHHEVNITEGGEFLDDALRMEDLDEETDKKPSQQVSYKHLF
jgi:hypothetical protein